MRKKIQYTIIRQELNSTIMKKLLQYSVLIMLTGYMCFTGCKKQDSVAPFINTPPPPPPPPAITNLHPTFFDTLSKARYNIVAGAAGNKIVFAGGFYVVPRCWYDSGPDMPGWYDCRYESTRVDIYDTITH